MKRKIKLESPQVGMTTISIDSRIVGQGDFEPCDALRKELEADEKKTNIVFGLCINDLIATL